MQGTKNLTKGPINRQLFNLAMPIMATSFIQMAYSLTDMAWVGRIGSEAVAAVGAVGILTWMSGSIALLNKVGSEVSVGQSIGARNEQDARQFASHNISIALLISICWAALLFLFANPILRIFELKEHITENAYCLNRTTFCVSVRSLHRNIQCSRTKQNTLLYQRHRIDYEYHTRSAFHLRFRLGNGRCSTCHMAGRGYGIRYIHL